MNAKTIISILKNRGIRYVAFRFSYELKRKVGWLQRSYPISYEEKTYISLSEFRLNDRFFLSPQVNFPLSRCPNSTLQESFQKLLKGNYTFFSSINYELGEDYDWVTNPDTGYKYDVKKHWTKIEDIDPKAGDIKYVWEKSRFTYLYTIIRYDYHFNDDHAELVINQIIDWIDKNPLNCGPNYKCSQEISLRILNWTFALNYYKSSKYLTEERFRTILNSIYWQINHVYSNINFSKICVRNNHAITETLTIYLIALLYPNFPDSKKWKKKGKKWFEKEINYQIDDDGTFIQNSMNYHRVVIQLLTWAICLSDKNKERFSTFVYEKAYKSINFLYQCQEPANGYLPNYGANDGALFFPLNDNDYRDYRPQLDALHYLLTGQRLYETKYEDSYWYSACLKQHTRKNFSSITKKYGLISFQNSGYYLFRERNTLTFIRCGLFKNIPGQADNLHLDIWHKGKNILMDAGSYKYNTNEATIKYFNGTESHNTVMLDTYDQMLKGPRFIWYYWFKTFGAIAYENESCFIFEGNVNCFRQIKSDIIHHRVVKKKKDCEEWIVEDRIDKKPKEMTMRQLWHYLDNSLSFFTQSAFIEDSNSSVSDYYGKIRAVKQKSISTKKNSITTIITI